PGGMGLNLKEELSARGDGAKPNPFLSPYTVVKRTDAGDLMWMPYAAYPPFAGLVHSLSRRLDDASIVTGADAGLARLLSLYAKALSGTDAYPFDEAFGAFASYKGRLKVLVGPYGTGRDPWGAKGFYGLVVGIQNETAEAVVAKATAIFPALEAAIARMAGEAHTPRQAGSEPSLSAVDVIIASGFSGGDEPLFLEFSLDGLPHGEGEARKRLIAVNHHDAKLPLLKAVANASLAPALAVRVDADGLRLFTILSTLADDVGLKAGAAAPADLAVLSRVKADAGGALAARLLAEGGAIGQGELFRFYAAYIATLVDRMRGLNESDAKAAAFELSYLAWHGALREQGARLAVNPDRLAPAVEAMLGETVRAFASGGGDGAAALLASYTSKIPDSVSISLESLSAAGTPRDAVVNYRVAGTER
ncbi:MAG TPA: hypothetical protein PLZ86_07635, partial [bacterium]|nr:hypothetical protein [bacterium]